HSQQPTTATSPALPERRLQHPRRRVDPQTAGNPLLRGGFLLQRARRDSNPKPSDLVSMIIDACHRLPRSVVTCGESVSACCVACRHLPLFTVDSWQFFGKSGGIWPLLVGVGLVVLVRLVLPLVSASWRPWTVPVGKCQHQFGLQGTTSR